MTKAETSIAIERYLQRLKAGLDSLDHREIDRFIAGLARARREGRQVFVMGNGGSAATASHLACDFNKGLSGGPGARFKVICLNDSLPALLAYANDLGYEEIFVEPLRNFLRPGDLVLGISGSGNSPNVVKALEYAGEAGAGTLALVGFDGGRLKQVAGFSLHVQIDDMQLVEDIHLALIHLAMRALKEMGDDE